MMAAKLFLDRLPHSVEDCIMFHAASLETSPRQGANKEPGPTRTLRFLQLVHRIHAGATAVNPHVVYGYAPMAPYPKADFSDVGFPDDPKACAACHLESSYFVPVKASPTPTQTLVLDDAGLPIKP
jgi:hypothetical protein